MREEVAVLVSVFQSKKQPLPSLEEMKAKHFNHSLHLPPSPELCCKPTSLIPHGGSLCGKELLGGKREGHDPSGRLMLCASPSCPAHLNPFPSPQSHQRASVALTEHQHPSSALWPLALRPRNIHKLIHEPRNICQDHSEMQMGECPPLKGISGKVLALSCRMEECSQQREQPPLFPQGI